eukprot:839088-Pelagomonas_calceolata.AAC.2
MRRRIQKLPEGHSRHSAPWSLTANYLDSRKPSLQENKVACALLLRDANTLLMHKVHTTESCTFATQQCAGFQRHPHRSAAQFACDALTCQARCASPRPPGTVSSLVPANGAEHGCLGKWPPQPGALEWSHSAYKEVPLSTHSSLKAVTLCI